MSELVFTTSPKTSTVPDITFELDEREYTALAPKKIVFMQFVAALSQKNAESVHGLLVFLDKCLGAEDRDHIETRFNDPGDDLDFEDLIEVMQQLFEEWEPYFAEEMAELSGASRANRRSAAKRTAKRPTKRAPAKRTPTPGKTA